MNTTGTKTKNSFFGKFLSGVFVILTWETVEELFEELLAYCISSVFALFITKALTTLTIVVTTQTLKLIIKKVFYACIRKRIKIGDKEMGKIKQFFTWLYANKKTLTATATNALVHSASGFAAISFLDLPPILLPNGFDISKIVYIAIFCVSFILTQLGVSDKGFEFIQTYLTRKANEQVQKEEKEIKKIALAEIKAEQKKANQTQAEQEKAQAKAEAERLANEAKAKAEAEKREKIEKAKEALMQNK